MNDNLLMSLKELMGEFVKRHPKFFDFIKDVVQKKLVPGTVIQISITVPGEGTFFGEMEWKKEDIELLERMEEM